MIQFNRIMVLMFLTAVMPLLAISATTPVTPLSANDLAILFPLEEAFSEAGISLKNEQTQFLKKSQFQQILKAAAQEKVHLKADLEDPSQWRLVALRYAPCIFIAGQAKPCKEQVRLILQPKAILNEDELISFQDYSMHIVYVLNESEKPVRSSLLNAFVGLKNLTQGKTLDESLQVNPVLRDQALAPAYKKFLLEKILKPFLMSRDPSLVTFMGLGLDKNGDLHDHKWIFFTGDIVQGKWVQTSLPIGVQEKAEVIVSDDIEQSYNLKNRQDFAHNIQVDGQDNLKKAMQIMSPILANDHNTSCVSCHSSEAFFKNTTTIRLESEEEKLNISKSMFNLAKQNSRLTETMVANRYGQNTGPFDTLPLRLFGYFVFQPVIGQRVVMDNAKAVEDANKLLGAVPQAQCSDQAQRAEAMECIIFGGFSADVKACVIDHCK